MPGIGSDARRIEKSDGYICSACRHGVKKNATACPHCNRNLRPPFAPHTAKFIKLGVFILILDIALFVYSANVGPEMPLHVQTKVTSAFFVVSAVTLLIGVVWNIIYPPLVGLYQISTASLQFGFSPLYRIGRWGIVGIVKCVGWCGSALASTVDFRGKKFIDWMNRLTNSMKSSLKKDKQQKPTSKEKRMRAGVRRGQTSDHDSERD